MLYSLFFASLAVSVIGKYTSGHLSTSKEFVYIDSFCFNTNIGANSTYRGIPGSLQYIITEDKTPTAGAKLVTYVDEFLYCSNLTDNVENCSIWSWDYVYGTSGLTCAQRLAHRDGEHMINGPAINSTTYFGDYTRPHYWYLALLNCAKEGEKAPEVDFKYQLTWLQPDKSQFSYDDRMQKGIYISFFVFYLALVGANLYGDFLLYKEKALHPIVRLLTLTILMLFVGTFFLMIHWSVYGSNGYGVPFLNAIGRILVYFDEVVFMFLLILLAKGWSITTVALTDKKILIGILAGFSILYVILFIWQYFGYNPAKNTTIYASVPGALLLTVRCITTLYFGYCLWGTIKETGDAEKKQFFYIFGVAYGLWFLSLPVTAAIASSFEAWYRDDATTLVDFIITFLAQAGLAILLWPSRAAKYFTISAPDLLGYKAPSGGDYGSL